MSSEGSDDHVCRTFAARWRHSATQNHILPHSTLTPTLCSQSTAAVLLLDPALQHTSVKASTNATNDKARIAAGLVFRDIRK